jgi:hypothetical protein
MDTGVYLIYSHQHVDAVAKLFPGAVKKPDLHLVKPGPVTSLLPRYDALCRELAEAKRLDEVLAINDKAAALAAAARIAKDRQLEIAAAELRMSAVLVVGKMIEAQKATVGLNRGMKGRKFSGAGVEPLKDDRPTLAEAGITKKLSSLAQKYAAIPDEVWKQQVIPNWRRQQELSPVVTMYQPSRNPGDYVMVNRSASKGLDLYCTPPCETRALFEHVLLPVLGRDYDFGTVWDPCCGLGHMSEVLKEYADPVFASDIYDYGYEQDDVIDFLDARSYRHSPDWVIGNSPYKFALEFALQGLQVARKGVAFLNRIYFNSSKERYYKLFTTQPPSYTLHSPTDSVCGLGSGIPSSRTRLLSMHGTSGSSQSLEKVSLFGFLPTARNVCRKLEDRRLAERKFGCEEPVVPGSEAAE